MHPIGGYDLCGRVVILAVMLAMAPLGAKAADLVV